VEGNNGRTVVTAEALPKSKLTDFSYSIIFGVTCIFLVLEFYLPYFDVGPVPLPNYFLLLFAYGGIIFILSGKAKIRRDYLFSFPTILVFLTLLFVLLSAITLGTNLTGWAKPIITKILIPLFLFLLTYYLIRFLGVDSLIKILTMLAGTSGLVAMGQALNIDFFWQIRTIFGAAGQRSIADQFYNRPTGLAFYSIELCYQLVLLLPLTFYLYKKYNSFLYVLISLFIIGGILSTRTYSAILALLVMFLIYILLKKRYLLFLLFLCLSISGTFYILNQQVLLCRIMRESTYARLPEAVLGAKIILKTPFGIGFQSYKEHAQDYFSSIVGMKGYNIAFHHMPHNQFLNSGIYYGWVVMLLTVYLYIRYCKKLWPLKDYLPQALLVAHLGYFVHSLFHNNGVLMGDRIYWHVVALTELVLLSNRSGGNETARC
jgi:hypothetical protein